MATVTSQHLQIRPKSIGLLTTIADLPANYKLQYVTKVDSPLDLTVKPVVFSSITPPATPSPLKKRYREENQENEENVAKIPKTEFQLTIKKEVTPKKTIKVTNPPKSSKNPPPVVKESKDKKTKAARKLKFDEETSSPVSGTIIISLEEAQNGEIQRESGDIDPQYNIVEVSDEVRQELAAIPNVIGGYGCKLCKIEFEDAFGLAQHRCQCIVLLEYRCPECGKRFNCPANLASHRRWHKPRDQMNKKSENGDEPEEKFPCLECGKMFKRPAYLRKHQLTHNKTNETSSKAKKTSKNSNKKSGAEIPIQFFYRSSPSGDDESNSNHSVYTTIHQLPQPPLIFNRQKLSSTSTASNRSDSDDEEMNLVINEDVIEENSRSSYCERFTEEENLAAAALAHLRNGPSVIRHTTALAF